jgi:hypothetical protein
MGLRLPEGESRTSFACQSLPARLTCAQGKFKVSFDGEERDEEGYLPAPGRIQDVLFSRTGLGAGVEHSLVSCGFHSFVNDKELRIMP